MSKVQGDKLNEDHFDMGQSSKNIISEEFEIHELDPIELDSFSTDDEWLVAGTACGGDGCGGGNCAAGTAGGSGGCK